MNNITPLPRLTFAEIIKDLEPYAQQKLAALISKANPRPEFLLAGENPYIGESRKYTIFLGGGERAFKTPVGLHLGALTGGMPSQQRRLLGFSDVPSDEEIRAACTPWKDPRIPSFGAGPAAEVDVTVRKRLDALRRAFGPGVALEGVAVVLKREEKSAAKTVGGLRQPVDPRQIFVLSDTINLRPKKQCWLLPDGQEVTLGGHGKMNTSEGYLAYQTLWIGALDSYETDEHFDLPRGAASLFPLTLP